MLDFPASGQALWALFDRGGPRPEYLLPGLYFESGFDPSVVNSAGYTGINQASSAMLTSYGTDSATYASWPASQQLAQVVTPEYLSIVARYGPLNSGTRAYQANFLPATLATATSLSSVLASQGDAVYAANSGLDRNGSGTITVGDLASTVAKMARTSAVQAAIANTYALRPGESPHDPVYGDDFFWSANPWLMAGLIVGVGVVGASLIREGYADDALRWMDTKTNQLRRKLA